MIASSSRIGVGTPKRGGSAASAGSVTDEQFRATFSAVAPLKFNSTKELIAESQKHAIILENANNDWSKRVKSLQALRALLVSGAADNAEFINQFYTLLGSALQVSVKDLRSQVCREACITVAFFCEKMGTQFWRVAEMLIPTLMLTAQNSAKVMATSAINASHYIAKYVRTPKILSLLMSFVSSKSKDARRLTASLIIDIITHWDATALEKSWPELMSALKTSIHDADVEARAFARQAFDALQSSYPQRAEFLYQELEPSKQRMLGGRSSTASSTHSINSERENVQAPNRGLYAAQQSAFLSKRSTSDLNHSIHSIRKLNLGTRVHRPNPVRSAKPPQASSALPKSSVTDSGTPIAKKLPSVSGVSRNSASVSAAAEKALKSSSQPGSRSTSPNRFRAPRSHIPAHSNDKKTMNGGVTHQNPNSAFSTSRHHPNTASATTFQHDVIVRALKNVDMQPRSIRPNIVKNDEDQAFALSPSTGFVNRNVAIKSRLSDSPNGELDFYGNLRHSNGNKTNSIHNNSSGDANNDANKWYRNKELLLSDPEEERQYIEEICEVLQANNGNIGTEKKIELALSAFSHMVRDGALSFWDDYVFSRIFLALIQLINDENSFAIKLSALRALKELCLSQPQRLVQKPELAMAKVLKAHECEDATVVRVAEECGAVLAYNLPVDVCLKLLVTVIDDKNTTYQQLAGAIKILSRVLEKLSVEDVKQLLPTVVGRMMKCYENTQSMVRRASIICLVAISNSIGIETLKPHLNASTLKLVEVYRDRMAKGK